MTWIAPDVAPVKEPFTGDERSGLLGWLASQRASFLTRCSGLTGEQLVVRAVPPSSLSLLGLVRHLADMEHTWFRRRLVGDETQRPTAERDEPFDATRAENAESDYGALLAQWADTDLVLADLPLDHEFHHPRLGQMSVRWLLLHVIREYAGHIGHADLLRERIDGTTYS